MTAHTRRIPDTIPARGRGEALTELRRSNAAGVHGRRRPGRGATRRRAITRALQEG
jgi:hypothetical protein